jgi:predicted phosphodiesterase
MPNLPLKKFNATALQNYLFCGHSHIALAQMDKRYNMLWLNPGACGFKGFHQVKTIFRFSISGEQIQNLACIELGPRVRKIAD